MDWDLKAAKDMLGIASADTSKDGQIQVAMNTTLALVEKYCNRHFLYAAETVRFIDIPVARTVQLHRYPVEAIAQVPGERHTHQVNKTTGTVILGYSHGYKGEVEISYTGGYKVLPADLVMAMFAVFQNVWNGMQPGAGGGGSVNSGGISSITVPDVGTIRYATTTPKIDSSSAAGMYNGLIPANALAILDLYKLEQC